MTQKSFNQNRNFKSVYINHDIKAPNIVIVDEDSNKLGKFPRRVAFEKAEEAGLDLIQLTYEPKEMVSTVIMADYGKYMYQKQKDSKEKKKNQKSRIMKEIKISFAIGDNDLNMKIDKTRELLEEGSNVKLSIRLKGRENIYKEKAVEKIMFMVESLSDISRTQFSTPKQEGRGYSILLFSKN